MIALVSDDASAIRKYDSQVHVGYPNASPMMQPRYLLIVFQILISIQCMSFDILMRLSRAIDTTACGPLLIKFRESPSWLIGNKGLEYVRKYS